MANVSAEYNLEGGWYDSRGQETDVARWSPRWRHALLLKQSVFERRRVRESHMTFTGMVSITQSFCWWLQTARSVRFTWSTKETTVTRCNTTGVSHQTPTPPQPIPPHQLLQFQDIELSKSQHTRELMSARKASHEHNNKELTERS